MKILSSSVGGMLCSEQPRLCLSYPENTSWFKFSIVAQAQVLFCTCPCAALTGKPQHTLHMPQPLLWLCCQGILWAPSTKAEWPRLWIQAHASMGNASHWKHTAMQLWTWHRQMDQLYLWKQPYRGFLKMSSPVPQNGITREPLCPGPVLLFHINFCTQ